MIEAILANKLYGKRIDIVFYSGDIGKSKLEIIKNVEVLMFPLV